ncbi:hypothetical protein GQ53DRAFT_797970 [Thozetella sp. PMI_491]|nr:hypothetical protein GQ53DRAFT_797970 [Thozetella sp. PMI_491]
MPPPTPTILEAFSLTGIPQPLAGDRELCYRVENIVLKPSDDDVETQWVSELTTSLLERAPTSYRLATPDQVVGRPESGISAPECRFRDALRVNETFNADLKVAVRERTFATSRQSNRWNKASRVTWEEVRLYEIEGVNKEWWLGKIRHLLDRSALARRPFPENGDILWENNPALPPAIIDLTLYWRPAEDSSAIAVADGLAWFGEGQGLIMFYGPSDLRLQLLVRALHWRILTFAIDTGLD